MRLFFLSALLALTLPLAADDLFAPRVNYACGAGPEVIAVHDLDNDGDLDLVTANSAIDHVVVLLGRGDGTFHFAAAYPVSHWPSSLAMGDIDGDSAPDLAVGFWHSDGNAWIFPGNGDGSFQDPVLVELGGEPCSIVLEDLDGDGALDLAASLNGSDLVAIRHGNGDGTFAPPQNHPVDHNPGGLVTGRLNGDDIPDLATANLGSSDISILLGQGGQAYLPAVEYGTGADTPRLTAIDIDGDGILDLAVPQHAPHAVTTMENAGDGTFSIGGSQPACNYPWSVAAGDFTADGIADLAASCLTESVVVVMAGDGAGSFAPPVTFDTGSSPRGLAAADLDNDTDIDLAVTNWNDGTVSILLNTSATGTISADLGCAPLSGTLPLPVQFAIQLTNTTQESVRRAAGHIDLQLGGGTTISNWRSGFANIWPGAPLAVSFNATLPLQFQLIGDNHFTLHTSDVTPAPYNQPPYLPSGDIDSDTCTVLGIKP